MGRKRARHQKALHCHVCSKSCEIGDNPDQVLCAHCDICNLNFCLDCCNRFLPELKAVSAVCFKCHEKCCCQLLSHADAVCAQCCDTSYKRLSRRNVLHEPPSPQPTPSPSIVYKSFELTAVEEANERSSKHRDAIRSLELLISNEKAERERLRNELELEISRKQVEGETLKNQLFFYGQENEKLRRKLDLAKHENASINHDLQTIIIPRKLNFDHPLGTQVIVDKETERDQSKKMWNCKCGLSWCGMKCRCGYVLYWNAL
jgi:hypothetical protein